MPTPSNPVGGLSQWRHDETVGNNVSDENGHANLTTIGAPPIVAGQVGNARDYSGGNGVYASGAVDATLRAAVYQRHTMLIAVKANAFVNADNSLAQFGNGSGHNVILYDVVFVGGSPTVFTSSGYATSVCSHSIPIDGNWHLVGFDVDPIGNTVTYSVDGVIYNTSAIPALSVEASLTLAFAHDLAFGDDEHLNGKLDVITFYPHGMTSGQVAQAWALFTGSLGQPAPTSVSPNNGAPTGGTAVTIAGQYFTGASAVKFDGVAATSVVVVDDSHITCVTPAHAAGAVDVVVEVDAPDPMIGTLVAGYTYLSGPTVASVTPNTGSSQGGTPVTVVGANFNNGATVSFGGSLATSVVVVDSAHITCITPGHNPGLVNVVVTNPDTNFGTLVNGYTFVFPFVAGPRVDDNVPANKIINARDSIQFDVVDANPIVALPLVVVSVQFPHLGLTETVHDGAEFTDRYSASSRDAVSLPFQGGDGYRFVLRRKQPWPESPTVIVSAVDANGRLL